MSTLKTHNLQSPDAGSVNISLTPNAGMIVAGITTFTGGDLEISTSTTTSPRYLKFNSNRSNADDALGGVIGVWNGNSVAAINFKTGADTTNKDDGELQFVTYSGGSPYERLRIDSNGMIGIGGVTPKTQNTFDAIEFGKTGFLGSQTGARTVEMASNAYYNSGWKYKENDVATQYYQYAGYHAFGTASSGSADGAVTFNEVFKINADGKAQFAGAADVWLTLGNQGTAGSNSANWIRGYNSDLMFNAASNQYRFEIAGAAKMFLRSDGNLYLRNATANYLVLGTNGSATTSGISNNMNWIRGNGANTQYNTSGGFHGFEISGTERFKIDANGYIYENAMPFGVLHGTTGWQYNNNGNGHYLLGNTASSSGGGNGSDKQLNLGWTTSGGNGATNNNFTPSNGIWTAPIAGYYVFGIKLYGLMNSNDYIQIKPCLNGVHLSETIYGYLQGNGYYMEGINETVRYYMNANDTFSWNAYGVSNAWRIYGAHCETSGYLVRGA